MKFRFQIPNQRNEILLTEQLLPRPARKCCWLVLQSKKNLYSRTLFYGVPDGNHCATDNSSTVMQTIAVLWCLGCYGDSIVPQGFCLKENVRYPVWTCRDPIPLILGTRFSILGSLKHLKKLLYPAGNRCRLRGVVIVRNQAQAVKFNL